MVYFANGGSPYLHAQTDMNVNSLAIDWKVSMTKARQIVGPNLVLTGNVDPIVLYTKTHHIEEAVKRCIQQAKGKHLLKLRRFHSVSLISLKSHDSLVRTESD